MKTFLSNLAALFVSATTLFAGSAPAIGQTAASIADSAQLEAGFLNPPPSARPWVYWFWNNGNVTKAGITADLEAMQRVGIGGVIIMDVVERFAPPPGPADFMNAEWQELFRFSVVEAARLGLEINMTNGPGWCGSSGPWITPELSMQKLVTTAVPTEGPSHFSGILAKPGEENRSRDAFNSSVPTGGYYRDIAVLAYPETANGVVSREQVIDLSSQLDSTGRLEWNVPAGHWIIQRIGHASTGSSTRPPVKGGSGLECDKLSREAMDVHFHNMMGKLIASAGALAGPTLTTTHIDSWEVGAQNWTPKFADEFLRRRGYNPIPFLPNVIWPGKGANSTVGSPPLAARFRWDFAQTVSELLAENYAGRLAELAHAHHLRLSIEGYHLPFGDEATYTARADEPMTEFWATGSSENLAMARQMASVAHVMGQKIVGAEAFTSGDNEQWKYHPATVKALGDYEFSQGVNRFVVHRYAHQPYLDRFPGVTMGPWGLHYERTQTWWEMSGAWHQYLARCQYLLRQGLFVADLCYLRPEQGDQTGFTPAPAVPSGYRYDECSAEALLARMSVQNGRLTLPDGMSYRVLVLPDNHGLMTPALLVRIKQLVADGATVLGPRPTASPSLTGYPGCDQEVARLAAELWGDINGTSVAEHAFGKGKVISGRPLPAILSDLKTAPDFLAPGGLNWIHRQAGGADVYFVANPANSPREVSCTFRVQDRQPELWDPETGQCSPLAVYRSTPTGVTVPLRLNGSGSAFVVFRSVPAIDPVLMLTRNDQPVAPAGLTAQFEIKRATYGVPGDAARTRDVRAKVQERAASGLDSFPVREMAEDDDPAFGVVKRLVVEGTVNGKPFTAQGQDPETIHLPSAVSVEIKRATYGVPGDTGRTRDVRAKVQERVNGGADGIVVGDLAEGDDPAFGVVKTLVVEGSVAGKPFTVSGQDPDRVYFAPAARSSTPAAEVLIGAGGRRSLLAFEPGIYVATTAAGQTLHAQVTDVAAPLALTGAWELRFPPHWGAPEEVALDQLVSWTEMADEGARHFSGTATYTKTFNWPPASPAGTQPKEYWLELGDVQVMARVKLNGHDLGVLWRPPFRTNITTALLPGPNVLEIAVANLWPNRMIADAALPSDQRLTWSSYEPFNKDTPLLPSGLLGPVTISTAVPVALEK